MTNVVPLPGHAVPAPPGSANVNALLDAAKTVDLRDVLILGVRQDGTTRSLWASTNDKRQLIYWLADLQHDLLAGRYDP